MNQTNTQATNIQPTGVSGNMYPTNNEFNQVHYEQWMRSNQQFMQYQMIQYMNYQHMMQNTMGLHMGAPMGFLPNSNNSFQQSNQIDLEKDNNLIVANEVVNGVIDKVVDTKNFKDDLSNILTSPFLNEQTLSVEKNIIEIEFLNSNFFSKFKYYIDGWGMR